MRRPAHVTGAFTRNRLLAVRCGAAIVLAQAERLSASWTEI